jgi:flagellar biosynthesis protein FliQ
MKHKNRILGILISTLIVSATAFTGIFENTLRGITTFIVLLVGLMLLIPHILEKLGKKQNG